MSLAQKGFTLIEVLVAVLLITFGLLGMAALQGNAVKSAHNSYLRSQATVLIYDIFDRMRANKSYVASYTIGMGVAAPLSPTTLAEKDLLMWKNNLANNIPQGDGSIAVVSGRVTVSVQWSDRKLDEEENIRTIQFQTLL